MKNTVLFALMILAALPASARKPASPNCSVNSETTTALAETYAARVDGLLRDAHACLRSISERVEAGSMSPERAQKLKFAVMRDVISRLDAISAVYDVRLNKNGATVQRGEELQSEAASRLGTARGDSPMEIPLAVIETCALKETELAVRKSS